MGTRGNNSNSNGNVFVKKDIRKRFDHHAARQTLKEKYQARMIFDQQGGVWRADHNFIVLLNALPDDCTILDIYDRPITVQKAELLNTAYELWQEQLNAWAVELAKVNAER